MVLQGWTMILNSSVIKVQQKINFSRAVFFATALVFGSLIPTSQVLAASSSISCVANPPVYSNGKRIYQFFDSAGRYCKAFVDSSTTERGYNLRDIYDHDHKLYISAVFDLANNRRLISEVIFNTVTGLPQQFLRWDYPSANTVIQTNFVPSSTGMVIVSKTTTINGVVSSVEEYLNGRINLKTIYTSQTTNQKISTVATTHDASSRIIRIATTTPYRKGESISNLDPGIVDYLDNTIPVTLIETFDPITRVKKTKLQQIKTAYGIVSQQNVLDPLGQTTGTLSRKYYDPLLRRNYSNVTTPNSPLNNGYSLTYAYNEAQLRKIRRQQLAVGEVYSDLAGRTDYASNWYNYPAPTASVPCPGSTSTERCLNVDLRDIFKKELDLVSRLAAHRKKHVFALIGDSITFQRTPGHPITRTGDVILNQGLPGDGTTQIFNRLNIIQRNDVVIDGVFLMVGINNFTGIFREEGPPSLNQVIELSTMIATNIGRVAQKIHEYQPKAKVFVQSVTPVSIPTNVKWLRSEHIAILNKKIAETIRAIPQNGLSYLDTGSVLLDSSKNGDPKYLQADGLHLNLQGQSRTGQVISQVIENQFP